MALTGEAKRAYQREYMRARRKPDVVAVVKTALGIRNHGRPRRLSAEAITEGQGVLQAVLRETGLDVKTLVKTVSESLRAVRPYGSQAISGPDNDARLRACDIGLRLHERAGTIPSSVESGRSGISMTVIEVNYSPQLGLSDPASQAIPVVGEPVRGLCAGDPPAEGQHAEADTRTDDES